ncbi:MAG TPA: DNA-directed RNA polymerase subunit alpha [bacterium]
MEKGVFQKPKRLEVDSETLTATYGKFTAEPFERGFGTTIGNSLRRVLLSSIEGAAVTALRIEGVTHEFATLPGMKEDIAEFVLNIKQLRVRLHGVEPRTIRIEAEGPGEVKAGDIQTDPHVDVLNPDLHLATLNADGKLQVEMTVKPGRGFSTAERNKEEGQPLGLIVVDAFFSPIERVNYRVENARVGQATDYDRLVIEVWTSGGVGPEEALAHAGRILRDHLAIFVGDEEESIAETRIGESISAEALRNLDRSVNELELSVRAANCLKNVELKTIRDLVLKSENEMLKTKNFGRKSLNEIKDVLAQMGLRLGMKPEDLEPRGDKDEGDAE